MRATHIHRKPRRRVSYLLRLWQAESDDALIWRASLQNPNTGEHRGFATLAGLLSFLEQEYGPVIRAEKDSRANIQRE